MDRRIENAKRIYETIINYYLNLFCEKHGFDYEEAEKSWVGNNIGGIVSAADYYFNFSDIKTDMEMDAPIECLDKYYWFAYEASDKEQGFPNYANWLKINGYCGYTKVEEHE